MKAPVIDVPLRAATYLDWPRIAALLTELALPLAGAHEHLDDFVVAEDATGSLLGCAGVEHYGAAGLLRSVAVTPEARGRGLGRLLVQEALSRANAAGCLEVVLLTTTAAAYFAGLGFQVIERGHLPAAVQASVEFASACPVSAVVMRCVLSREGA